jgi:hypothetical protein
MDLDAKKKQRNHHAKPPRIVAWRHSSPLSAHSVGSSGELVLLVQLDFIMAAMGDVKGVEIHIDFLF